MPEVEVSRFIRAPPREVRRLLTPETVLNYEGTFTVVDVDETTDGILVTARAPGMQVPFLFEERPEGLVYEQTDDIGPFRAMMTDVAVAAKDEGSVVTMRSTVRLRLPIPFADRIAAWKRRGEMKRALARLATDVE